MTDTPRESQVATELRRVKWKRRALEATGGLAIALAAGFSLWISYSKPTAPPREQPMPPIVKADQGKPTVKDELKPEAGTPAVANAAPAAPTGSSVLKKLAKCGVGAAVAAGVACAHTIQTGTQAGACPNADAVKREFEGKRIPDVIHVRLDESNPKGNCTGKWGQTHITRDEPCPVYEGGKIIMRMTGGSQEEEEWGLGPDRTPWKKGMVEGIDWLWGRDGPKPSLLIGTTHRFDATGKYDVEGFGHPPRDLVGRMTALVTEIRRWDGEKVPVCGVLYGHDGQVGVPIFSAPDYDKPTGGEWGDAYVKFFWHDKK